MMGVSVFLFYQKKGIVMGASIIDYDNKVRSFLPGTSNLSLVFPFFKIPDELLYIQILQVLSCPLV